MTNVKDNKFDIEFAGSSFAIYQYDINAIALSRR